MQTPARADLEAKTVARVRDLEGIPGIRWSDRTVVDERGTFLRCADVLAICNPAGCEHGPRFQPMPMGTVAGHIHILQHVGWRPNGINLDNRTRPGNGVGAALFLIYCAACGGTKAMRGPNFRNNSRNRLRLSCGCLKAVSPSLANIFQHLVEHQPYTYGTEVQDRAPLAVTG